MSYSVYKFQLLVPNFITEESILDRNHFLSISKSISYDINVTLGNSLYFNLYFNCFQDIIFLNNF